MLERRRMVLCSDVETKPGAFWQIFEELTELGRKSLIGSVGHRGVSQLVHGMETKGKPSRGIHDEREVPGP